MRLRGWRAVALALTCLISAPAAAQLHPVTTAQGDNFGYLGDPPHVSDATGIPFFTQAAKRLIDDGIGALQQAAAACDSVGYNRIKAKLGADIGVMHAQAAQQAGAANAALALEGRRQMRDVANMGSAYETRLPAFDEDCFKRPRHRSAQTGRMFFKVEVRDELDDYLRRMRQAGEVCDAATYNRLKEELALKLAERRRQADAYVPAHFETLRGQERRDAAEATDALLNNLPPLRTDCDKDKKKADTEVGSLHIFGGAGGTIHVANNAVVGVDRFGGPGAFLIDTVRSNAASPAFGVVGLRNRLYPAPLLGLAPTFEGIRCFFDFGIQFGLGDSFRSEFQGVSAVPQGMGFHAIRDNYMIPLLVGMTGNANPGGTTPIFIDAYAGISINSTTHSIQGREVGAGAANGNFWRQNTRTAIEPVAGLGVRVPFADSPFEFRFNVEAMVRSGSVVTVESSAFNQSYFGSVDPRLQLFALMGFAFRY